MFVFMYLSDINDCPVNECNGNGNCTDLVNDYECNCEDGFYGDDCERRCLLKQYFPQRLEFLIIF